MFKTDTNDKKDMNINKGFFPFNKGFSRLAVDAFVDALTGSVSVLLHQLLTTVGNTFLLCQLYQLFSLYTYLLLTEFEARTVSYGPSFFPFVLWPKREV